MKLTTRQREALTAAAKRWDRSLVNVDMRTVRPLIARGLVEARTGTVSHYNFRKGHYVSRTQIIDLKITTTGRGAVEGES